MFYITGTVVGKVNATDRDKKGTLHVKIKYTLLTGLDLFAINPETGAITTVTNTLDREVSSAIIVLIIYSNIKNRNEMLYISLLPYFKTYIFFSHYFVPFFLR